MTRQKHKVDVLIQSSIMTMSGNKNLKAEVNNGLIFLFKNKIIVSLDLNPHFSLLCQSKHFLRRRLFEGSSKPFQVAELMQTSPPPDARGNKSSVNIKIKVKEKSLPNRPVCLTIWSSKSCDGFKLLAASPVWLGDRRLPPDVL